MGAGIGVSLEEKGRKAFQAERSTSLRACMSKACLSNYRKVLLLDSRVSKVLNGNEVFSAEGKKLLYCM